MEAAVTAVADMEAESGTGVEDMDIIMAVATTITAAIITAEDTGAEDMDITAAPTTTAAAHIIMTTTRPMATATDTRITTGLPMG